MDGIALDRDGKTLAMLLTAAGVELDSKVSPPSGRA